MKSASWLLICTAAMAQQPAPPADPKPPAEQAAKPEPAKPADAKPADAAEAAAPADSWLTGYLDLGYRWQTGLGGNSNVYRSMVDLGEGPKLLDADFRIVDPNRRLFDRADVRAANWGDDPYTTLSVTARKQRVYDFISSYRNLAYFNNLPTFANPLLNRGILNSERIYDQRNRMSSYELNLLPGNSFVPYVAYERASGYGTGVTTFVSDQNEYAVPDRSNFSQNNFRGGIRTEMRQYHFTWELGGTTFRDDQSIFVPPGANNNPGNREGPYVGQSLYLNSVSQAYGVRGRSIYNKLLGTAEPFSWLAIHGQYLITSPQSDTNYQQYNTGNFVLPATLFFYTSQNYLLSSMANSPHHAGSAGAEIRLHPRIRVLTNWMTDRIEINGSSIGQQTAMRTGATRLVNVLDTTTLRNNYNHLEADVLWDITSQLTLRGGYRYVWGDTRNLIEPPSGLPIQDTAQLRRNVGKAGFNYRPGQKFSLIGDLEAAGTDQAYFRTSIYRYQRGRVQGSYQLSQQFVLSASFSALNNRNPSPSIDYNYLGMQTSASILWNPRTDNRFSFQGTYTRSTIKSDIGYLAPQLLQPERSLYRDNAHSIQGMFDLTLPRILGQQGKLTAGGNFFISSGSRPTNFFQPSGKLTVPIAPHVAVISEWTYYGYAESFYSFEGFRTHLITAGIRLTR